jgi:hypothetical protein
VLEIAVGRQPLPEHEADVLRVIYDRLREPPVQFLRERRLARAEPAVDPDDHRHKLSGYPWAVLRGGGQPGCPPIMIAPRTELRLWTADLDRRRIYEIPYLQSNHVLLS